jgi:hypothetical protein
MEMHVIDLSKCLHSDEMRVFREDCVVKKRSSRLRSPEKSIAFSKIKKADRRYDRQGWGGADWRLL